MTVVFDVRLRSLLVVTGLMVLRRFRAVTRTRVTRLIATPSD
jgi:hypothetical protein